MPAADDALTEPITVLLTVDASLDDISSAPSPPPPPPGAHVLEDDIVEAGVLE